MNPLTHSKNPTILPILIPLVFVCFGPSPTAQAVVPPPDGGYGGGNTAEGTGALNSLVIPFRGREGGEGNTALGFQTLLNLTTGDRNTATGFQALLDNTASFNTADGYRALFSNTTGSENTATGAFALFSNTTGGDNTAVGRAALGDNTTGDGNTAVGSIALVQNTTGDDNVAVGSLAGRQLTAGNNNVFIGPDAGHVVTTADDVICIGSLVGGENVSNSCYIGNIYGEPVPIPGLPVVVNSDNKLGTQASSKRFKQDIRPLDETSEALFSLKPVAFRYNKEIDPAGTSQFGLVAEDVEKVNRALVVRDKEGKPYSVRYDQVNAMLLNEFLKEHRKVEEHEKTIAELKSGMTALAATVKEQAEQIQKVSAQIQLTKAARQVVKNDY